MMMIIYVSCHSMSDFSSRKIHQIFLSSCSLFIFRVLDIIKEIFVFS